MILSATLSKPAKNASEILGGDFLRVKIRRLSSSAAKSGEAYFCEFFTKKQVFHKKFSEAEFLEFLEKHSGKTFRNCVERTEDEEIQILSSKRGKITEIRRKIEGGGDSFKNILLKSQGGREKSRILKEGNPVPFLVRLGIMTAEGKVVSQKFDKFRQINRFLEIFGDLLPEIQKIRAKIGDTSPLRIVDFGSGKSYLTFALHYFLREIKKIDCDIFGLDLKEDVVEFCSGLASELGLEGISFAVGDISGYSGERGPDVVVTLHACDTATDFALEYAVKSGVSAILSVPCCQKELNSQISKNSVGSSSPLFPLLRFGLIKERFAALATDAIRAQILEKMGYRVQILEFVDAENSPKNLMIRALKSGQVEKNSEKDAENPLLEALGAKLTLDQFIRGT